jgi:hypothetical protein
MEFKDKNNKEVKKTRIEDSSSIYDNERYETPDKQELSKLSMKDKLSYFKEYYLKYTIIVIVTVIVIICLCISIRKVDNKKDTFYCGLMGGLQFEEEVMDNLPQEFYDYLKNETDYEGYNSAKRIFFDVYYATFIDDIKVDGYFDQNRFDIFITRSNTFEIYVSNGTITDLSTVLPDELLEKLDDKIVYASVNSGEQIPYGILLDDIRYKFYDGAGDEVDPPILSIPSNTKRLDVAIAFIEFITQ